MTPLLILPFGVHPGDRSRHWICSMLPPPRLGQSGSRVRTQHRLAGRQAARDDRERPGHASLRSRFYRISTSGGDAARNLITLVRVMRFGNRLCAGVWRSHRGSLIAHGWPSSISQSTAVNTVLGWPSAWRTRLDFLSALAPSA